MAFAVGPASGMNWDVRKRSRRVAPQCCDKPGLYRRNRESMSPEEYNTWRQDIRKRSLAIPLVVDFDPIHVVYEDDDLIAVAKPGGLKVHPAHRFVGGTLINRVNGYLGYPPKTLHRLDQSTSGVVLMGKRKGLSLSEISRSFRNKEVTKEYLAIVDDPEGLSDQQSLVVNAPICRDDRELFMRRVGWDGPEAKEAQTRVDFLDTVGKVSLVRAVPFTGRTHQIRVHLQHIG